MAKKLENWRWKTFHRENTIWDGFQEKIVIYDDLKNSEVFAQKKLTFFEKNKFFEPFENFYYSIGILRHLCYRLVKTKSHVQKRDRTSS